MTHIDTYWFQQWKSSISSTHTISFFSPGLSTLTMICKLCTAKSWSLHQKLLEEVLFCSKKTGWIKKTSCFACKPKGKVQREMPFLSNLDNLEGRKRAYAENEPMHLPALLKPNECLCQQKQWVCFLVCFPHKKWLRTPEINEISLLVMLKTINKIWALVVSAWWLIKSLNSSMDLLVRLKIFPSLQWRWVCIVQKAADRILFLYINSSICMSHSSLSAVNSWQTITHV